MKKKMRGIRSAGTLLLVLIMLIGLIAGCSSNNPSGQSSPSTSPTTGTQGNEAAEGEVDYEAVVTVAMSSGWTDLIPYNNAAGGQYSNIVLGQIYDLLFYVGADGTVSPRAAKSWEQSEDQLTATFYLDEGCMWHDGTPVTAEDYVFTVELITDPDCPANNKRVFDELAGVDENGVRDESEPLGIEALDEYTIRLTFDEPINLEDLMTGGELYIYAIPKHLLEGTDPADYLTNELWNNPIGNGPCVFESTVAGTQLTVRSNENYQLGQPGFGTLIIEYMSNTNMASALIAGDIDFAYPAFGADDVELCRNYDYLTVYRTSTPTAPWMMVMSNVVYTDSRVRQAFSYALDRELLCATLGSENFEPMATPVYEGSQYYNPEYTWTYDPDRALEILRECEADGTFSFDDVVTLYTPAGDREKAAAVVQQNLSDLGLTVEVMITETAAMFGGMVDGEIGIGFANYSVQPNPMYFASMTSNVGQSYVMCTTDMWDNYWSEFTSTSDPEERAQIMDSYQADWLEEQPSIFYACAYDTIAYNSRLGDNIYYEDLNSNGYNWATWNIQVTK